MVIARSVMAMALISGAACAVEGDFEPEPGGPESPAESVVEIDGCRGEIQSLEIFPAETEVDVVGGSELVIQYRALARFSDGTFAEVPAAWSVNDASLGLVDGLGEFRATGEAGGRATIAAEARGVAAARDLGIRLVRNYPEHREDLFGRFAADLPRVAAASPRLTRPSESVDIAAPEDATFEWESSGEGPFRLAFRSATSEIAVYTETARVDLSLEVWSWLVNAHRGGRESTVLIEQVGDGVVHRATDTRRVTFCSSNASCESLKEAAPSAPSAPPSECP